ncbi:MAG: bifunctional folylpolyglutamate synthase/dihydrofolate synthase [Lachnospiraceae bacterium]|nr:bifunctional folylpolyglutamate synthase/dihydrofolate synthase [Lachnospiraceae bacterium]
MANNELYTKAFALIAKADAGNRVSLEECENFINTLQRFTTKHSIDETRRFLDFMGAPDENMNIIHVAGTNGKGSVCSYLSQILQKSGYTTGMFISPHLISITERFRIDDKPIREELFGEIFLETLKRIDDYNDREFFPTYFEFLFFMAMTLYDVYPVDYLILETGLGGRLDATNSVRNPKVCVITEIGLDHMQYLGNTVEQIAGEKAGIIKPGVPVVYFDKRPSCSKVISDKAAEMGSPSSCVLQSDISDTELRMDDIGNKYIDFSYKSLYDNFVCVTLGTWAVYQTENASIAARAAEILREKDGNITSESILEGLKCATWEGRMEQLIPGLYVDGAHNIDGIEAFVDSVRSIGNNGQSDDKVYRRLLFGVVSDKQYPDMIRILITSGLFDDICVTNLATERSVSLDDIKETITKCQSENDMKMPLIRYYTNVRDALINMIAERKAGDLIYVTGSLYLVGEVRSIV